MNAPAGSGQPETSSDGSGDALNEAVADEGRRSDSSAAAGSDEEDVGLEGSDEEESSDDEEGSDEEGLDEEGSKDEEQEAEAPVKPKGKASQMAAPQKIGAGKKAKWKKKKAAAAAETIAAAAKTIAAAAKNLEERLRWGEGLFEVDPWAEDPVEMVPHGVLSKEEIQTKYGGDLFAALMRPGQRFISSQFLEMVDQMYARRPNQAMTRHEYVLMLYRQWGWMVRDVRHLRLPILRILRKAGFGHWQKDGGGAASG